MSNLHEMWSENSSQNLCFVRNMVTYVKKIGHMIKLQWTFMISLQAAYIFHSSWEEDFEHSIKQMYCLICIKLGQNICHDDISKEFATGWHLVTLRHQVIAKDFFLILHETRWGYKPLVSTFTAAKFENGPHVVTI